MVPYILSYAQCLNIRKFNLQERQLVFAEVKERTRKMQGGITGGVAIRFGRYVFPTKL